MIIYKDALSDDELFSDQFPITEECDGLLLRVEAKYVSEKQGVDDSNFGFNKSEEGGAEDEDVQDAAITVLDLPHRHQFGDTQFNSKKEYQAYIKGYMKRLKAHLEEKDPDKVACFTSGAPAAVKYLLEKFKDLKFYVGISNDLDAMLPILHYDSSSGEEKYMFYFFKHGLKEEKV